MLEQNLDSLYYNWKVFSKQPDIYIPNLEALHQIVWLYLKDKHSNYS